MLAEPKNRISKKALTVWKINGIILSCFLLLFSAGVTGLLYVFDWPKWILFILVLLNLLFIYFFVFFIPKIRWRRWRYELRDQEIELQHGLFIITKTLVPIIRVQHVDTSQGPIMKKYRLASVVISTAATNHEIPALDEDEAENLRESISHLVRVVKEDV